MHNKQPWRNLPESFVERLPRIIPNAALADVRSAFSVERPTTLRVNTLKISTSALVEGLAERGFIVEPVQWWKHAFILKKGVLRDLTEIDLYKNGSFYVQSFSSMIPALVLDPKPEEKVLDLCAAPGSKTTQMAALMENKGQIVANDNSQIRIYRLLANLRIQGVTNTQTVKSHGQILWQNYREYFDKTLVDVPCSMEGRFFTSDPKSYLHWSMKKVKELAERQRFLLRSAVSATRVGGTVVYSTCTLSPEENESVIDWLLKKEPGVVEVLHIDLPNLIFSPALLSWKDKLFTTEANQTIRILPSSLMEGFYIAKLRKIRSNVRPSVDILK